MLLDAKSAAEYLGCSAGLLLKWRLFGGGPTFCKFGRLVRYREEDLVSRLACRSTDQQVRLVYRKV